MERRLVLGEDGTCTIGDGRYGDTIASGLSRADVAGYLAAHAGESFEYFDGDEWSGSPPEWLREAMRARSLQLTCGCPGEPCIAHLYGPNRLGESSMMRTEATPRQSPSSDLAPAQREGKHG